LGVDPAAGGDKSAIVLKSGNLQQVMFNQKLQDTMDLVGVIQDLYREWQCDLICIDHTGVGRGVYDRLKQMDYPIRGVAFGGRADDEMFANLKAEIHWKERKWLLSGGRLIQDFGWNEFEIVKYKNKDGKIFIQPKEELFKDGMLSPNVVDAAVLTMAASDTTIKSARTMKYQGNQFQDKMLDVWRG
jgi:hypothetical protein